MSTEEANRNRNIFNSTLIGELEIPADFNCKNWMEEFIQSYRRNNPHFTISAQNVREPSHIPMGGSKIRVSVVEQTVSKTTTAERM